MSPEPTPTPTPTPTANESGLSLETEPLLFFNPTLAGLAPPGSIQPFPGPFPFDEEPAIWARLVPGDHDSRRP
jgi:hypothetical protein